MQGIEVGIDGSFELSWKESSYSKWNDKKIQKPVISFTMNIPGPIKQIMK